MHLDAVLIVEDVHDILLESRVDILEIGELHLIHRDTGLLTVSNALAGNVMCLAERDAKLDEIVGDVSGEHERAVARH